MVPSLPPCFASCHPRAPRCSGWRGPQTGRRRQARPGQGRAGPGGAIWAVATQKQGFAGSQEIEGLWWRGPVGPPRSPLQQRPSPMPALPRPLQSAPGWPGFSDCTGCLVFSLRGGQVSDTRGLPATGAVVRPRPVRAPLPHRVARCLPANGRPFRAICGIVLKAFTYQIFIYRKGQEKHLKYSYMLVIFIFLNYF